MAGIGFELKKMMAGKGWLGVAQAYTYSGIIGSGPWVLSILGILLASALGLSRSGVDQSAEFMSSVTYLIATSLVLSGVLQLLFVRFMADRVYEGKAEWVLPNLLGALTIMSVIAGVIGSTIALLWFRHDPVYALLMLVNFVVLCNLWLTVVFVSGLKQYQAVLLLFFISYALLLLLAWLLRTGGTLGGLLAVLAGHSTLLLTLLVLVMREYQGEAIPRFDFMQRRWIHPSLIITGVLFNLGVWIDKWIFWFAPTTSDTVNGVLRASIIYDTPFFLAYLSIIPGMAVFLIKVETDFVETYQRYYSAVNGQGTLSEIQTYRQDMVKSIRDAFKSIFFVQSLCVLLFFWLADDILAWLNLSPLFVHLYRIDLFATLLQVLFLTTLSISFYFNLLRQALWMCLLLTLANALLTLLSLWLGATFYGYGFALALLLATAAGIAALSAKLNRLEYLTFMMQR